MGRVDETGLEQICVCKTFKLLLSVILAQCANKNLFREKGFLSEEPESL